MSLFKKFKRKVESISNDDDLHIYEQVCAEIERGERDLGVWGKAFTQANGDESKAKAKYIELMVALRKENLANLQRIKQEQQNEHQRIKQEKQKEYRSELKRIHIAIGIAESRRDRAISHIGNIKAFAWLCLFISIIGIVLAVQDLNGGVGTFLIAGIVSIISFRGITWASVDAENCIDEVLGLKDELEGMKGSHLKN